jgi:hypothetical protein
VNLLRPDSQEFKTFEMEAMRLLLLWSALVKMSSLKMKKFPTIKVRTISVRIGIRTEGLVSDLSRYFCSSVHRRERTNGLKMSTFWRIFHHDGKLSPAWWGVGGAPPPPSLYLSSWSKLWCTP